MKQIFIIVFIMAFLTGCTQKESNNYSMIFRPQECNYIYAANGYRTTTIFKGVTYFEYYLITETPSLKPDDYILSIYANNRGGLNDTGTPIPSLEREIEQNYRKNTASTTNSGYSFDIFSMEYRTTGITQLSISSLDTPLFGKAPGASLNEYFNIIKYDPDFIASYETNHLLYGFNSKNKPTSIEEWLSLSPMGQPSMSLHLNTLPGNLPLSVRFVVYAETSTGKILCDTTNVVTFGN